MSAENASRFADEPEFVVRTCFTPRNAASRRSNASLKRPVVSQPSSDASTMLCSSAPPITLPEGGITVVPGTNGAGANASAGVFRHQLADPLPQLVLSLHGLVHRSARASNSPIWASVNVAHVRAAAEGLVPRADLLERAAQRPTRAPSQPGARLRAIELQVIRLVRLRRRIHAPTTRRRPSRAPVASTTQRTGRASSSEGPKFQASAKAAPSACRRSASAR